MGMGHNSDIGESGLTGASFDSQVKFKGRTNCNFLATLVVKELQRCEKLG